MDGIELDGTGLNGCKACPGPSCSCLLACSQQIVCILVVTYPFLFASSFLSIIIIIVVIQKKRKLPFSTHIQDGLFSRCIQVQAEQRLWFFFCLLLLPLPLAGLRENEYSVLVSYTGGKGGTIVLSDLWWREAGGLFFSFF